MNKEFFYKDGNLLSYPGERLPIEKHEVFMRELNKLIALYNSGSRESAIGLGLRLALDYVAISAINRIADGYELIGLKFIKDQVHIVINKGCREETERVFPCTGVGLGVYDRYFLDLTNEEKRAIASLDEFFRERIYNFFLANIEATPKVRAIQCHDCREKMGSFKSSVELIGIDVSSGQNAEDYQVICELNKGYKAKPENRPGWVVHNPFLIRLNNGGSSFPRYDLINKGDRILLKEISVLFVDGMPRIAYRLTTKALQEKDEEFCMASNVLEGHFYRCGFIPNEASFEFSLRKFLEYHPKKDYICSTVKSLPHMYEMYDQTPDQPNNKNNNMDDEYDDEFGSW